jgi:DNA adenine methylase
LPVTLSPLRYPGGKTALYPRVSSIIKENDLHNATYIEPFAGGCGLALKLLLNRDVSNIVINDIDICIYTFWYCVLYQTDKLCSKIDDCTITIKERNQQIDILRNHSKYSELEIGFATLYVNRTSVSGILTAGPIGGKAQKGIDRLNARFKKKVLVNKISNIASYREKIKLYNLDAMDFMDHVLPEYDTKQTIVNFDPPYVKRGQELYLNHYCEKDHKQLSRKISQCNYHWIVTYDYNDTILDLYSRFRHERIELNHSAGYMKKGQELMIFSDSIQNPQISP